MSERIDAPFAPLKEGLPAPERAAPESVGRARVTTWTPDAIALEMPRRIALGFALAVLSLCAIGGAQFLRASEETLLISHALTLVAIPLVLVAFRALFSKPRFLVTSTDVRQDSIQSPLARFAVMPFTDVEDVRVRLFFERYKDVMRVVSARVLVVARDGRTLSSPSTDTLPTDEWRAARDAMLPLAREIARRTRVPLIIDHAGPLPPALRDAESTANEASVDAHDDDDDES
jgi:hypothetical protein